MEQKERSAEAAARQDAQNARAELSKEKAVAAQAQAQVKQQEQLATQELAAEQRQATSAVDNAVREAKSAMADAERQRAIASQARAEAQQASAHAADEDRRSQVMLVKSEAEEGAATAAKAAAVALGESGEQAAKTEVAKARGEAVAQVQRATAAVQQVESLADGKMQEASAAERRAADVEVQAKQELQRVAAASGTLKKAATSQVRLAQQQMQKAQQMSAAAQHASQAAARQSAAATHMEAASQAAIQIAAQKDISSDRAVAKAQEALKLEKQKEAEGAQSFALQASEVKEQTRLCQCKTTWYLKGVLVEGCTAVMTMAGARNFCEVVGGDRCSAAGTTILNNEKKFGRTCSQSETGQTTHVERVRSITAELATDGPCQCLTEYSYHGKQYGGCIETPDRPGHLWCFVAGGERCPVAQAAQDPQETRRLRECHLGETAARDKATGLRPTPGSIEMQDQLEAKQALEKAIAEVSEETFLAATKAGQAAMLQQAQEDAVARHAIEAESEAEAQVKREDAAFARSFGRGFA
eukprot:TRINITY_DN66999_c0_g1_i1.p1 TRINITY_DN66999_c0_g1~~TRINITY_DN66999_c0_g1_i1.p1  ORF type:complete len:529 (+),score=198.63 TRINITY_DN66999_c0_g1_i1:435-2021(+)